MTAHATGRIAERLALASVPLAKIDEVLEYAYAHIPARGSAAVLIGTLDRTYGDMEHSSGNELWSICRDGRLVTVMLRRSGQPCTPYAMRVDEVIR